PQGPVDARRLWHIDAVQVAGGVHPIKFRSHLGGTTRGDCGPIDSFRDEPTDGASPSFCGPLGRYPRGAADTRRLRVPEAVKRKLQVTRVRRETSPDSAPANF